MDDTQLLRYSRHILLEEVGIEGQEKLLGSHALVIGAGGLGSPVALYLGSAGVGHITVVDHDTVDATNLQRQIAHTLDRVGQPKAESVRTAIAQINPDPVVKVINQRADEALLAQQVAQADVVLDCTDNFATRHAINRACVAHRKPLVSGAAIRFDAQLAVFDLRDPQAPCYACLYPEDGQAEEVACATMGVFAPLTGVVGAMQALEAVKLLAVAAPRPEQTRLLLMDALSGQWRSVRVKRDAGCAACGGR